MPRNRFPKKRPLLIFTAVIPVFVLSVWILTENPEGQAQNTHTVAPDVPAAPAPETTRSAAKTDTAGKKASSDTYSTPASLGDQPFARSLAGTHIDGSLKADSNGNLIVSIETKDFFDYFLNTVGEVSAEKSLAEIERLARENLPPQAAEQALALLDQYLSYKKAALALGSQNLDPGRQHDPRYQLEMLKGALTDLKQLRRNAFDADTHDAFFGLEEAYGDYTLASMDIQQRTDLSPEAKATLQEWHRQQLPDVIRRTETRMMADGERYQQRQKVLANASSPQDAGEQLRAMGVDPAQTAEVVTYLEEREKFDQRFEQYRRELASLDQSGIAREDRAAMETRLLKQHFEDEQSRSWAKLRMLETQSQ